MIMTANLDSLRSSLERAANEIDMAINDINLDRALDDSIPDHDSIDLVVEELCAVNKRLAIISMACGFEVLTGEDGVILR